jgi:hypothetical protein
MATENLDGGSHRCSPTMNFTPRFQATQVFCAGEIAPRRVSHPPNSYRPHHSHHKIAIPSAVATSVEASTTARKASVDAGLLSG